MERQAIISSPPAMPARAAPDPSRRLRIAGRVLDGSAAAWFVVAVAGQWLLAAYVVGFYWVAALQGDFARWNRVLPHGFVPGDAVGNLVVGVHLMFAVFIIIGGALQLVPAIRRHWPRFHRWNGRFYLGSALVMSIGGLVMVVTRGGIGDFSQHAAISINALLIIAFAAMALRHALARRFDLHRRWALRLFLAVSGVWFFRVGMMFWILVNRGPAGFDPERFVGPFLTFLAFAQYLLPLALLELYFRAQASSDWRRRTAMAALLGVATLVTAVGSGGAAMMLWLPRL